MKCLKTVACMLAILLPAAAQSQETTLPVAESAGLDAVIDPFLESLSGAASGPALLALFETSTSSGVDADQLAAMAVKIDEAREEFGAVDHCVMFDQQLRSPLLVQRKYMCQHPNGLSQWRFILKRLPDRWAISNINFRTRVAELFEESAESGEGDDPQ